MWSLGALAVLLLVVGVWIWRKGKIEVYVLERGTYKKALRSAALPELVRSPPSPSCPLPPKLP